ncbi:MAG: 6-carboxytetrahydropterin synthase QueD [bacterium]
MYELMIKTDFSAAHQLRNYKGKCENLHGHNWKIEVYLSSDKLNDIGLVVDFGDIKSMVNTVLDEVDHKNLNDLPVFQEQNPSSENIAKWIYTSLEKRLINSLSKDIKLTKVTVWESDTACASYII